MDTKRGLKAQATLFVIIAILIVVLALSAFLIYRTNQTQTSKETSAIKQYLSDQLKEQVLINIQTVTYQGGQAYAEGDSFTTPYYSILYWVNGNETNIPPLKNFSDSIDSLNEEIKSTNLSQIFNNTEIISGELKSNTTFSENKTIVEITCPITIKKEGKTERIENFNFEYDLRVKRLYEASKEIAELVSQGEFPNTNKLPPETNLTIYEYEYSYLYEVTDLNPKFTINDYPLNLVFAVK